MLQFIAQEMNRINIAYAFGEWGDDIRYPYFVGELTEQEPTTEDGAEEATMLLTGFHRGSYEELEAEKERIKSHFDAIYGARANTPDGGAIAVFYAGAFYVPTGEAGLKKIQINLTIKKWKGAI